MPGTDVPDLADLIGHDHRVIDGLLHALGSDRQDRLVLAHRLIDEAATHLAAVTQVLLPALRDIVPGGVALANAGQEQVQALTAALRRLEEGHPGDAGFEAAIARVTDHLHHHVTVEENEHLPALRTVVGDDALAELGRLYGALKDNMPSGMAALPGSDRDPQFRTY